MTAKKSPFATNADVAQRFGPYRSSGRVGRAPRLTAFGHPLPDPISFPPFEADRSTDAAAASPSAPTFWGRFWNQVAEDCAAFGVAVYPPMHERDQRGHLDPYAAHGNGPAPRDIGDWFNAPLSQSRNLDFQRTGDSAVWVHTSDEGIPPAPRRGWADTLTAAPVRLWKYLWQEYAISRAISNLSRLDDRTLRDIGVNRGQIHHVARHGRNGD